MSIRRRRGAEIGGVQRTVSVLSVRAIRGISLRDRDMTHGGRMSASRGSTSAGSLKVSVVARKIRRESAGIGGAIIVAMSQSLMDSQFVSISLQRLRVAIVVMTTMS